MFSGNAIYLLEKFLRNALHCLHGKAILNNSGWMKYQNNFRFIFTVI